MEQTPPFPASGLLAALTAAAPDAVIATDANGLIITWPTAAENLFGEAAPDVIGHSFGTLLPEGHRGDLDAVLEALRDGRRLDRREMVARTKRGRLIDLLLSAAPIAGTSDDIVGCVFVLQDVTQRNRTERAQRSSERQWRSIIESAVDGIIVIDSRGLVEAFNPAAERLFQYGESEVVGRNVAMLMPAPYAAEHDGYLERYLREGQARIIGIGRDVKGRKRDGTTFPLHLSVGEMSIDGERKFTGIVRDLTARAQLEDQLRTSEARWRAVIEAAVDGILVIDPSGTIEAFNPAAERLFGYTEAEAIGRNVSLLMPEPYRREHDGYLARYMHEGAPRIIGIGREVRGRRRDGSTFPVHLSVSEMRIGGEPRFTGILHDLSDRVVLEAQLREQTAMARLGEMAALVAHEIRNPLAAIRGAVQIIGGRVAERDASVIKEITARIDSLNGLMNDLLLFARPPQPRLAPTDVSAVIAATADLLAADPAAQGVRVEVSGPKPTILADAELLKIAFHNLLVNGAHAMRGSGQIDVTVGKTGPFCDITFVDHGPGIPAHVREQIFTPFFTTKPRGSGLGLPTARRLVEAHAGEIFVESPPTGGTAVVVRLPAEPDAGRSRTNPS